MILLLYLLDRLGQVAQHNDCWPIDSTKLAELFMVLGGHRTIANRENVDSGHIGLPDDQGDMVIDMSDNPESYELT